MLSPQAKRNLTRILPFGAIWLIFSFVYSLLERGLLGNLTIYPATGNPYDFSGTVFITAGTALVCGLLIGSVEVLYLTKLFQRKSFARKILYKTSLYLGFIVVFLLLTSLFFNSFALQQSIISEPVLHNTLIFFTSFAFWSVVIYIGSIIGVSLFYHEVNENLGQGVLRNFFSGKYHTPKEEERVFMFLDMKGSTTLAERIGHGKYFEMLKEYFADLSDPIIRHAGKVYQYVGDEVVITWTLENGLHNNNCIACFFSLKDSLQKQKEKYKSAFGIVPEFKAGLHVGIVTTGEIGVIKKEIIFTGDVLNTTARIQSLCNSLGVDILISGQVMNKLTLDSGYQIKSFGESELRGRDEKIELYTILLS
jgi:adenylate cyclase